MSQIRREKLLKKYEEKSNWKAENAALLARAKKAEAQIDKSDKRIFELEARVAGLEEEAANTEEVKA
jgi:predicted nuclease with TOPRIM domain